jgi:TolB-like protein/class 3 adenylate cyclase
MSQTRRLAAILAADVAGYSRLMGADEEGTLARLKAIRRELADPKIRQHRGRIVKTTGDGLLVEFPSVVDAVRCAVEVQREMAARNAEVPQALRIELRMGINLGDIIKDGRDIYGDGVNIAARLEALAEPGGICVSRVVRDQVRDKLAFSFEDMGEQEVKNIARPVRVHRIVLGEGAGPSESATGTSTKSPLTLPDKPSIAVLPFQNMSGDPEQEYFVDGMVEEIITALSRIRWLLVIARNSSFSYKGRAVDVKQVARELGVRYVLEGSVRKAGNRVRITGQLIDTTTGAHIWADRFDGTLDDIFELQDQVASSVAGVIEPALRAAEARRSAKRPTSDLTAYDLYLRALAPFSSHSEAGITRALDFSEQAIGRDPHYGSALGYAAACRALIDLNGWTEDRGQNRRAAIDCAERALESAGDDPVTLVYAAHALAYFGENIDAIIALVDRALALNPSFAGGWLMSAQIRIWAGQPDLAIAHVGRAIRLSPRDYPGTLSFLVGLAHFLSRRFEDAMPKLIAAVQHLPNAPQHHRVLASCYAHMGRLEEARAIIERLRTMSPLVVPELNHFRNPEHRELLLSGLRLAAGEAE